MSDWFPIEIIPPPRDGKAVLVYDPRVDFYSVAFWVDGNPGYWMGGWYGDEQPRPTHWIPLPEPPK